MNSASQHDLKKQIIETGKLLWAQDLASGRNGNISMRCGPDAILMTAHGSCLGFLTEDGIVTLTLGRQASTDIKVSTEYLLHSEIYTHFPHVTAVVHTHSVYTNAFFSVHQALTPCMFETRLCVGEVIALEQNTPAVTDARPVIQALKKNNITVLRHHGSVAIGANLFDCFVLIQGLEEAAKVDALRRIYTFGEKPAVPVAPASAPQPGKKFRLFSPEQIDEIVRLANTDAQLQELGKQTKMTMTLAVKLDDTGVVYRFAFQDGAITAVEKSDNAEFVISAPEHVWRAVFNREIDPFVATTQKKMRLHGDFAKISKWYAPCSRIFELWHNVPVE